MKLNKWLYGAAALVMLTACSERDIAPGGTEENGTGKLPEETVTGYLAVQINLPQETGSTRGETDESNDYFLDGEKYEYKVGDDNFVLLFKGPKLKEEGGVKKGGEKEAKYYRAKQLTKPFLDNKPTNDQITSSYLAAIPVTTTLAADESFWGLVFINAGKLNIHIGTKEVEDGEDENGEKLYKTLNAIYLGGEYDKDKEIYTGGLCITEEDSFQKILDYQLNTPMFNLSNGEYSEFFMTNAPLSTKKGGLFNIADVEDLKAENIQYLTQLDKDNIKDTEEEAKLAPAGCIYVERAVAKVTGSVEKNAVQLKLYSGKKDAEGKRIPLDLSDYTISASVKYGLTHTNKISYLVRNVEFNPNSHFGWDINTENQKKMIDYRMVGYTPMVALGSPFHPDVPQLYRTYWCKDPNYGKEMNENEKGKVTGANELVDFGLPLYCRENTFEVQYQNYGNSTLAIFEVTYTVTKKSTGAQQANLYIKDGNAEVIYVDKYDAASDEITRIVSDPIITEAMKKSLKTGVTSFEVSDIKQYLDFTIERQEIDGKKTQTLVIKDVTLKTPATDNPYFDSQSPGKFSTYLAENDALKDLLEKVNALNEITEYTGGKSYYVIPVMHFGDYYCPWNGSGTTTKDVYNEGAAWTSPSEEHASKYLGRYGMVRNNWYELSISQLKGLGEPTFPTITGTLSDDNLEEKKYFAIEIHVLSWAKRTQSVEF